jgi:hypothetical protein
MGLAQKNFLYSFGANETGEIISYLTVKDINSELLSKVT